MFKFYRNLTSRVKQRLQQWFRITKSINNVATLNARQIYIIPTRWCIFYALMLLALLIGAINYTLSLAYIVTFLLASLANVVMLHTWRNLAYLQVTVLSAKPVFSGDLAEVNIQITELKNRPRHAICMHFSNNATLTEHIAENENKQITLSLHTSQRGYSNIPRITLFTEFPLNLFHAWALVDSPFQILVYPKPSNEQLPMPNALDINARGNLFTQAGDEDFIGHKTYQIGDLPSKVDWKASSRGIGMFSKLYSGEAASTLYLDWLYTTGDTETRISQLTRWVIDAHAAQLNYGLKLNNNVQLKPDHSEAHYHACLKALATL
jgi:uncharacterized protein (DUF58 family)